MKQIFISLFLIGAFMSSAIAGERPTTRCTGVIVDPTGNISNNGCEKGNIIVVRIPEEVDPIDVASRICQFRYQIIRRLYKNGTTSLACIYVTPPYRNNR